MRDIKRKSAYLPAVDYEVTGPDGFVIGVERDEGYAPELDSETQYASLGTPETYAFLKEAFEKGKKGLDEVSARAVTAPDLDALEVSAPPPRKPLVAQSARATVSGDDNIERGRKSGILDELSQGIDVDERAALNDPRASASASAAGMHFNNARNRFLALAGLPTTPYVNPYAKERDEMRDWLMKRAGVAQRGETAGLNAERTKAYLDSIQAARERDLAAQKFRAEQEGRKTDAAEYERKLKEERAKVADGFKERELKLKEDEAKRKAQPKPGKPELPPDEVAFDDMVFQWQGGAGTPKAAKEDGAKKMREKAAQWNTVVTGLNQLDTALTNFIKNPSPETRSLLYGPALSAAGATNAAIGQGAMSADEKAAQFQALGVSLSDAEGFTNLVERAFNSPKAAEDIVKRVRQMKKLARDSVAAQGQPYGYLPKGTSSAPAAAPSAKLSPEDEKALKWAKANKDDPRAKAILERLGATP